MTSTVLASALASKIRTFDVATHALTNVVDELRRSTAELGAANADLHERLRSAAILHLDALHIPALLCTLEGVTRVNSAFAARLGGIPTAYEGHEWAMARTEAEPAPAQWETPDGRIVTFRWHVVALNNGQFFCYDTRDPVEESAVSPPLGT